MKTPPSILAAFTVATLLSPAPAAHAQQGGQDSNPPGRTLIEDLPKLVRVQVEWIEVPHTTFTRLMWEESERESATPHQSLDNTPLRRAVAELVAEGEARVIDTAMIVAPSGERARVESQNEHIYPTEIDRLPSALEVPAPAGQDSPQIHVGQLPFPVVFEMRPVGIVLEIDPEIDRRVPIIHQILHALRSFLNQRCCSARPVVDPGGWCFTPSRNRQSQHSIMPAVSAARMSSSRTVCNSSAAAAWILHAGLRS